MKAADYFLKYYSLPQSLKQEVNDFIGFLLSKNLQKDKKIKKSKPKLKFDWEGAVSDMRNEYTSVQLQHQLSQYR